MNSIVSVASIGAVAYLVYNVIYNQAGDPEILPQTMNQHRYTDDMSWFTRGLFDGTITKDVQLKMINERQGVALINGRYLKINPKTLLEAINTPKAKAIFVNDM